jgi:hypothetical protein
MSQEKYIGMDVHQATISAAVMDAHGKLIMACLLETKAATILEFLQGLHRTLAVTFEEGTSAAWLHDLLQPHVSRLSQVIETWPLGVRRSVQRPFQPRAGFRGCLPKHHSDPTQ